MKRLLALDEPEARDPRVVGSKASRLALARAAGLPVLPGWILPARVSARAIRLGAETFERSGHAAARLAVANLTLDPRLLEELRHAAGQLGGRTVVRSSSWEEADARWSGALVSYLEVREEEMPAAVRGCWASVFSRDALARCRALGVRVQQFRISVLVQPWLDLEAGGTASTGADGRVAVSFVAGAPAPLTSGLRAGGRAEILPDGTLRQERAPDGVPSGLLADVAALARAVREATGDDAIEWGVTGGRAVLLQARSGRPRASSGSTRALRPLPPEAERMAWLASRYPAPLGDELVLPWALGSEPPRTGAIRGPDPPAMLAEIRRLGARLVSDAWGLPPKEAAREAAEAIRSSLGPQPDRGLARLREVRPVEPGLAARMLGLIAGIAEELVSRGVLPHPDLVWRLSSDDLDRADLGGLPPPLRGGPDRWEPFVFDVVRSVGEVRAGTPVAPGTAAGSVHRVDGVGDLPDLGPRRVLVARFPVPQLAPLLWDCAGLVTAGGGVGAHLFDVASSLGVPAVVGVDLVDASRPGLGVLAAVDGDRGSVALLHDRRRAERRAEGRGA